MRIGHPARSLCMALAAVALPSACAMDPCRAGPGTICTWAGTGHAGYEGEDELRDETPLYWPVKVRFGPDQRAYILDWNNHRVRRVESDETLKTVIGTATIGDGPDQGDELTPPGVLATAVNLNHPTDLAFLPDGTAVLAAWHNHKLRRWDPATQLAYVACGRGPGFAGDGGPAHQALLDQPRALAVDTAGNVFLVDQRNQRIRRIRATDETITTVVGTGVKGYDGDGAAPLDALLAFPDGGNPQPGGGVALDDAGRLYIADTENHRVRRVDFAANQIVTVAGTGVRGFSGDGGPATDASLHTPRDIDVAGGSLYIADTENHRIRRVELDTGMIDTVAGAGEGSFGDGRLAIEARLNRPYGVTVGPDGALYIADTFNHRIRRVEPPVAREEM